MRGNPVRKDAAAEFIPGIKWKIASASPRNNGFLPLYLWLKVALRVYLKYNASINVLLKYNTETLA